MITCDKCGFGHKTFEELRACKSWEEIVAAGEAPQPSDTLAGEATPKDGLTGETPAREGRRDG